MFDAIAERHPRDGDLPARARTYLLLRSVLDGTFYDALPNQFHQEKTDGGEYIPLRDRRPSVRYNLCRIVVEDATTLVFGEERFPRIHCGPDNIEIAEQLNDLVGTTGLCSVMKSAAITGSVGSVAILMRVLGGRIFWEPMQTAYLTPTWKADAPDTIEQVRERYKVRGSTLRERGYEIPENDDSLYWFGRTWTATEEQWFLPKRAVDGRDLKLDESRTVRHNLGFVPMLWVRNLEPGDGVDGLCTFKQAIDTQIEIEYQLSQAGRGLKYSSDPTLMVKEPAEGDGIIKGAGNALVVSEKGDAKLLEIGGTASAAVIDYARFLRELAMESIHGNRSDPNRFSAAQSGRALETMNNGLIGLAGEVRSCYGTGALRALLRMAISAAAVFKIKLEGGTLAATQPKKIKLVWPDWYPLSAEERRAEAQTLQSHRIAGNMSRHTAVGVVSDVYDVPDAEAEIALIKQDEADADARLAKQAAQTKATEIVPS